MSTDLGQIVDRYGDAMFRLAYSYCGHREDAEDIVQEVLLQYLKKPPDCKDEQKLRAWLLTVTANKCRSLLRSPWRRSADLPETACVPSGDTALAVRSAVEALPPKARQIVYLFYYEELSTREIAKILHLSETAVRSRLFQARKHLKLILKGGDWNE